MEQSVFEAVKFALMVVDADSLVHRSAVVVEETFVVVTHKKNRKMSKEFKNKTEFYGHHAKKEGGWLAEHNEKRAEKGKRPILPEEFDYEEGVRPASWIEDGEHVKEGLKYFENQINYILDQDLAYNLRILIGDGGNYRDDAAQLLKYKGERKEKPMFFKEVRAAIIKRYKKIVELVRGREVDDQMAIYGIENLRHKQKTGEWMYLLSYLDKDLKGIPSPAWNFDGESAEIVYNTVQDAARFYATQLLAGDKSTDNIQGLPDLALETKLALGLPKRKGCGMKTAEKVLEDCETVAEIFTRVCECYRTFYGDQVHNIKSWRGEDLEWTWKDFLQENALLLFMNPLKDPASYNVMDHLVKMGVDLDNIPLSVAPEEE